MGIGHGIHAAPALEQRAHAARDKDHADETNIANWKIENNSVENNSLVWGRRHDVSGAPLWFGSQLGGRARTLNETEQRECRH